MSEERRTTRRSIFFPVILIILGIIFLLSNIGVLADSVWENVLRLWPVLLLALGIDGVLQRQSLVGPVFLIGLGTVFLLANLGYLALNAWELIFRLWPVLLIAIGLDIVIGRRSFLLSLVGLILVLALLIGALWLFSVRAAVGQPLNSEQISQMLDGAQRARLILAPAAGSLRLVAMDSPNGLLEGNVRRIGNERITSEFSVSDQTAIYSLRGTGGLFFNIPAGRQGSWSWDLAVTPAVPLNLEASLGAGQALIDLTGLDINELNIGLGVGQATVILPQAGSFAGSIDGAIGQIVILVPERMALRINADTGIANINVPSGFDRRDDIYATAGFDTAANQVELNVGQAIGNIEVRYTE